MNQEMRKLVDDIEVKKFEQTMWLLKIRDEGFTPKNNLNDLFKPTHKPKG